MAEEGGCAEGEGVHVFGTSCVDLGKEMIRVRLVIETRESESNAQ